MSIPDESPLFLPEPSDEPLLGTSHARVNRSRKGEMTALWILLGIVGLCGVGYAIHLAIDTQPAPVTAPPAVVQSPATPHEDDHFGDETVRLEALRHRLAERKNRAEVPVREAPKPREEPVVEVVREPDPPPIPPEGRSSFDSGDAFDRPAVDSSRRRRPRNNGDFGTYQVPVPRRQAEISDRPNQPGPSFDEPATGRPMRKRGARP